MLNLPTLRVGATVILPDETRGIVAGFAGPFGVLVTHENGAGWFQRHELFVAA